MYRYCMEYIVEMGGFICSVLLAGVLLRQLVYSVIFLVVFLLIRSYAGGYHSKSALKCYVMSVVCFVASCILKKALEKFALCRWWVVCGISMIMVIAIICLSPVESANKPLTPEQRQKNKIISALIVIMAFAGDIIHTVLVSQSYAIPVILLIVLISQIAGLLIPLKH